MRRGTLYLFYLILQKLGKLTGRTYKSQTERGSKLTPQKSLSVFKVPLDSKCGPSSTNQQSCPLKQAIVQARGEIKRTPSPLETKPLLNYPQNYQASLDFLQKRLPCHSVSGCSSPDAKLCYAHPKGCICVWRHCC